MQTHDITYGCGYDVLRLKPQLCMFSCSLYHVRDVFFSMFQNCNVHNIFGSFGFMFCFCSKWNVFSRYQICFVHNLFSFFCLMQQESEDCSLCHKQTLLIKIDKIRIKKVKEVNDFLEHYPLFSLTLQRFY